MAGTLFFAPRTRLNLFLRSIRSTSLLLVGAASVWAQDSARRAPRIDVDSYAIRVQISPDTQSLNARAVVKFTPLDDNTSSAVFELNNALNVSRITDEK